MSYCEIIPGFSLLVFGGIASIYPKKVGKRVILALLVDKLCPSHGIHAELFGSG